MSEKDRARAGVGAGIRHWQNIPLGRILTAGRILTTGRILTAG